MDWNRSTLEQGRQAESAREIRDRCGIITAQSSMWEASEVAHLAHVRQDKAHCGLPEPRLGVLWVVDVERYKGCKGPVVHGVPEQVEDRHRGVAEDVHIACLKNPLQHRLRLRRLSCARRGWNPMCSPMTQCRQNYCKDKGHITGP